MRHNTNLLSNPEPSILNSAPPATPPHKLLRQLKTHFQISIHETVYKTPCNLAELQQAVRHAHINKSRIRPTTHPTSESSHFAHESGCTIINTSLLNNVTMNSSITVAQCGARLNTLRLPLIPPDKSVGSALADGALALGGFSEGLLADCLLAFSVIDSLGRLRHYRRDHPGGLFRVLVVSHGLSGIIFDATFKTSFTERVVSVSRRLESIRAMTKHGLKTFVDGCTAVHISWVPFNSYDDSWDPADDEIIVHCVRSFPGELCPGRKLRYVTIPEYIMNNCTELSKVGYTQFEGWHTKMILSKGFVKGAIEETFVSTLREAVGVEYDKRCVVEESVCFPINLDKGTDWERVVDGWESVVSLVTEAEERGEYPLNVLLQLRFCGTSDGVMAANREGEVCAVLTIVSAVGTKGWSSFAGAVVGGLTQMGGRWLVNRSGAGNVDGRIGIVKRVVRNAGLDDCGLFEDILTGGAVVRMVSTGDVDVVRGVIGEVVVERDGVTEFWWVWWYLAAYVVLWWWFFGEELVTGFHRGVYGW